ERAGVALVGVTADVFLLVDRSSGKGPFPAGGETSAAPASQAGVQDDLDDLFRGHLGEDLTQRLVAVHADVLVDILGVDDTAVAQGYTVLLFIKIGVVEGFDGVVVLDRLL